MRIVIIQGAFLPIPPAMGGAVEKMWFALGKEFTTRGHSVLHISQKFSNLPNIEWIDGVMHKRVKGYKTPSSGLYLKYLDLLYSIKAISIVPEDSDIVITNTFWSPIFLSSKLKKRCMVDVQRMPKGQMHFYGKISRLRTNSSAVEEAVYKEISQNNLKRIVMIPNPLPFKNSKQGDPACKKPIILYVGRIHPEKGLELLINAFKLIESNWKLKIVGPWETEAGGGGLSYLQNLKFLAGDSNIEFLGPIYNMDILNKNYKEASLFVYPSIAEKGETFGLAPLEAMAWGCATIVSNLACFRDFIIHEENGLIFNHREKHAIDQLKKGIERLINDRLLRYSMANKAQYVRESHSISNIASQFLKEFEQMLQEITPANLNTYENSFSK